MKQPGSPTRAGLKLAGAGTHKLVIIMIISASSDCRPCCRPRRRCCCSCSRPIGSNRSRLAALKRLVADSRTPQLTQFQSVSPLLRGQSNHKSPTSSVFVVAMGLARLLMLISRWPSKQQQQTHKRADLKMDFSRPPWTSQTRRAC